MERTVAVQLGILLVLFGGFFLVDANSSLPLGLDVVTMFVGLSFGVFGACRPE